MIESEAALDRLFVTQTVTQEKLTHATADAAALHGQLRALHLKYHVAMRQVLSPVQVRRYAQLRGYTGGERVH